MSGNRERVTASGNGTGSGFGGGVGGAGTPLTVFDVIAGPLASDKSLAAALAEAAALVTSLGRTVTVGLKAGAGVGYTFGDIDWPASVNLWGPSGSDGAQLDGRLRVLTGGRRRMDGIRLDNTQGPASLYLNPSATAFTLARDISLANSGGLEPSVDQLGSNSALIVSAFQAKNNFPSPVATIRSAGGTISLQDASFVTHGDYDTPSIQIDGGSLFIRRCEIDNPVHLGASTFAQIEHITHDAFQVGRIGTAWLIGAGALMRIRNSIVYGADGVTNAVFDGTGTVDYTDFACPQLDTMAGVLFDAGLTVTAGQMKQGPLIP